MGLFLGKKRRDIRAWEDALFEKTANRFVQPDIALYERLTKAQIENDCRIILESAQIMVHTSDSRVAESRRKLIGERYAHLMTLKPFAERSRIDQGRSAGLPGLYGRLRHIHASQGAALLPVRQEWIY